MLTSWDSQLADFLRDLSAVQGRTLEVLTRKREMLVAADSEGLAAVASEEEQVMESLQQCLARRETLLSQAKAEGLPSDSLRSLTAALPPGSSKPLSREVQEASHRARLLQHHSLINWVLVQKTLLHLSQLLEIIATGGRLQPTYSKDESSCVRGGLVDHAV